MTFLVLKNFIKTSTPKEGEEILRKHIESFGTVLKGAFLGTERTKNKENTRIPIETLVSQFPESMKVCIF